MEKNLIIGLFIFLLSLLAIPASGKACTADSDCLQGQFCSNNYCYTGSGTVCASNDACPQGEYCGGGKCISECKAHCDCPQGFFCYYGKCLYDPNMPIYCCSSPGCPPGNGCFDSSNGKSTCAEQPDYVCQSTCDCGPAHCCKFSETVGHKVCVKDINDPWKSGGTAILGLSCNEGVDPTWCCGDPLCYPAKNSYEEAGSDLFLCYENSSGVTRNFCGGKPCYFSGDCKASEGCIDTRPLAGLTKASTFCNAQGGFCAANAVLEAVYGVGPLDILPACSAGVFPEQACEEGWRPGGKYAVQRILGTGGSCGNGICESWETAVTCPADCRCGDGVCDSTEVGFCAADCGTCGDGVCSPFETRKNCPADCPVVCGDGSCDAGEATTCPQDCGCPESPTYADAPIWCGDGVCQAIGDIPENHANCPLDCAISLVTTASPTSVCEGANTQVTFTSVVTNNTGSYSVSGSVIDNFGAVGSFSSLASGASVTLTKVIAINAETSITSRATGSFNDPLSKSASATAKAKVTTHACDTTPPTITLTCPGKVNLNTTAYASVNVMDTGSGVASQSAANGNDIVDTSTVGSKTFTVSATDNVGNTGSNSCSYQVIYDFSAGFAPPIADLPALNAAKAGQTVPVKWQLLDGKGGFVSDLSAVTSVTYQHVQCSNLSDALTSEVTATASGSSGLHYDLTANQFVYNWNTTKSMAGNCYVLTLKLYDRSQYQANFSLK